jgi:hypothetical protein
VRDTEDVNQENNTFWGQHWALAFNGGNGQWCVMVLAMDDKKTMGDKCLMDESMDYSKEEAWQWQQRLHSTEAAVGGPAQKS